MKKLLFSLFILTTFCFAKCEKDKIDFNGLPTATQEGKNTLGFLLNGQPWTPKGFNGTANLSIDFDPGLRNGIFSISAYRIISNNDRSYFGIGVNDSINTLTPPKTYSLGNNSLYGIYFSDNNCTFDYFDNTITRTGMLTITKLDRTNRIISGTFNATVSKNGCTIISITEGRFDMKF
ncbi:MAG: hypothetical protein ACK4HE_12375 [Chitinophagaceae bacterium]|jgi:hypothetical protein